MDNTSRNTLLVVNGDKSFHGVMGVTAAGSCNYLKSHDLFPYYPSDPLLTACNSLCVCARVEADDKRKAGGGVVKGKGGTQRRERQAER